MTAEGLAWLTNTLFGWTWLPIISVARTVILGIFSNLDSGRLLIVDETNGTKQHFGTQKFSEVERGEIVELVVKHELFWLRVLLFADIGFGESYMLGEFDCDDLTSFFRVGACSSFCSMVLTMSSSLLRTERG